MFRVGAWGIGGARRRGEVGVDMFTRDIASTDSTGALRKVVQGWACEQEEADKERSCPPQLEDRGELRNVNICDLFST
jgi:hypothetical protein